MIQNPLQISRELGTSVPYYFEGDECLIATTKFALFFDIDLRFFIAVSAKLIPSFVEVKQMSSLFIAMSAKSILSFIEVKQMTSQNSQ